MTDTGTFSGISKAQIEDIKDRIRIEDIVKRYVPLKQVGKNLFGLCPFHAEKTPSFSVNPELNFFKCYGCGESGDVIAFLQKIESLEFNEAMEMLAKEAGVTLHLKKINTEESRVYSRAAKAHDLAAHFFQYVLLKHSAGNDALKYAKIRKLTDGAISEFGIGYAPAIGTGHSLVRFLQKEGFSDKELVEFGLCTDKSGRIYDKFVDRLMFSIHDTSGTVIGFSGRVFRKNDDRPKYINSPETILFQKRKQLFGLYQAKQSIRKADLAVLVEGQIDVISSWMNGVKNVVAPLGTGITATQIDRIRRFTHNLAIAFDTDGAGEHAHYKLAIEAYSSGFNVTSVRIPYGKDVDECVSHDPALWIKAIEEKIPSATYFLNRAAEQNDPQTLSGKQAILSTMSPLILSLKDKVSIDHHIKELHLLTDIPIQVIEETLKAPVALTKIDESRGNVLEKKHDMSQGEYLIALLLQFPNLLSWASKKITAEVLPEGAERHILDNLLAYSQKNKTFSVADFVFSLPAEFRETTTDLLMKPFWKVEPATQDIMKEINSTLRYLKIHAKKTELADMRRKLSLAEKQNDTKGANDLLNAINDTLKHLESLQSEDKE